jgi:hypothetical protein
VCLHPLKCTVDATTMSTPWISTPTPISCAAINHHLLRKFLKDSMCCKVRPFHCSCSCKSPTSVTRALILNRIHCTLLSPVHKLGKDSIIKCLILLDRLPQNPCLCNTLRECSALFFGPICEFINAKSISAATDVL